MASDDVMIAGWGQRRRNRLRLSEDRSTGTLSTGLVYMMMTTMKMNPTDENIL